MPFFRTTSLMLALLFCGLASSAQAGTHTIGDACTAAEIGRTEMDRKETGIIGCFRIAEGSSTYQWASTSGASSTGNCYAIYAYTTGWRLQLIDGVWTLPVSLGSLDTLPSGVTASTVASYRRSDGALLCQTGYTRAGCSSAATGTGYITVIANGCVPACYTNSGGDGDVTTCPEMRIICCKTS